MSIPGDEAGAGVSSEDSGWVIDLSCWDVPDSQLPAQGYSGERDATGLLAEAAQVLHWGQ